MTLVAAYLVQIFLLEIIIVIMFAIIIISKYGFNSRSVLLVAAYIGILIIYNMSFDQYRFIIVDDNISSLI